MLRENTDIGGVSLVRGQREIVLDARTSDAVALALRGGENHPARFFFEPRQLFPSLKRPYCTQSESNRMVDSIFVHNTTAMIA